MKRLNRTRSERKARIANTPKHPAQPTSWRRPKGEHRPRETWTPGYCREMNLVPWPDGLYWDHEWLWDGIQKIPVRRTPYAGPKPRNDGHDEDRIQKAKEKRARKALHRAGR